MYGDDMEIFCLNVRVEILDIKVNLWVLLFVYKFYRLVLFESRKLSLFTCKNKFWIETIIFQKYHTFISCAISKMFLFFFEPEKKRNEVIID